MNEKQLTQSELKRLLDYNPDSGQCPRLAGMAVGDLVWGCKNV